MNKSIFNWTSNEDKDDFNCRIRTGYMGAFVYLLRAEQMEKGVWWWCIYNPKGEQVISSHTEGDWSKTVDEAKTKAEKGFLSLQETKVSH